MDPHEKLKELERNCKCPEAERRKKVAKNKIQSALREGILAHPSKKPEEVRRMRLQLERWNLDDPRGDRLARRALTNLHSLRRLCTPRVCSAVMRTVWNGWCTNRRFQKDSLFSGACVLGCGGYTKDSIEHYARCPRVKSGGLAP